MAMVSGPQKQFMMTWNGRDIHGFLLQYIGMCNSDVLIFLIPECMLYPCRGPDSYRQCCEVKTLS